MLFLKRSSVNVLSQYFRNPGGSSVDHNCMCSTVHDILNVSSLFNLYDDVKNMVERDHFYYRLSWQKKVWAKAWEYEDVYCQVEFRVQNSLDFVKRISNSLNCITWWYLSDKYPAILCETLA